MALDGGVFRRERDVSKSHPRSTVIGRLQRSWARLVTIENKLLPSAPPPLALGYNVRWPTDEVMGGRWPLVGGDRGGVCAGAFGVARSLWQQLANRRRTCNTAPAFSEFFLPFFLSFLLSYFLSFFLSFFLFPKVSIVTHIISEKKEKYKISISSHSIAVF